MSTEVKITDKFYPVLCLRGLVAFPGMMLTLDVGRKKSVRALTTAMDTNQTIYLVTQKDITVENPEPKDLYSIGCVCKVRQVLKVNDGVKVLVQGLYRAKHQGLSDNGAYYSALVEKCEEAPIRNRQVYKESLIRRIRIEFEKYVNVNPHIDR